MDDKVKEFFAEVEDNIKGLREDKDLQAFSNIWTRETVPHKYSYNFTWMGRPIIQYPQDIIAMQELVWKIKPDLIVETGIAHGGSLIFYASLLELLGGEGEVLGVDIEIRPHNRREIEDHPMFKRITMYEGSSVDEDVVSKVFDFAKDKKRIIVVLDSDHRHDHVLKELEAYSPLVKKGSYLVVFDTIVEDMPKGFFKTSTADKGDSPKTAVWEFLKSNNRFKIDKDIDSKLLLTVCPDGYLECIAD